MDNLTPDRSNTDSNQKFSVKTIKWLKTGNIYLSFFGVGLCVAVVGPTLLDLATNVNVGTEEITSIYVSRSAGYLCGALLGGVLFDRYDRQIIYTSMMLISTIVCFVVPWCSHLALLAFCLLISGFALGSMDTGGNVWILNIWTKESGPFMQALHFVFGFGALVAPLIAEPFLRPLNRETTNTLTNDSQSESLNLTLNNDNNGTWLSEPLDEGYYIINAYSIISAFMGLTFLLILALYIISPADHERKMAKEAEKLAGKYTKFDFLFIFICFCFYFVYGGMEVGFGQLLTTFAVKGKLALTKSVGSFMTSAFWGSFTFGRGLGIFFVLKFSPFMMLLVDLIIINIASLLLVLFSENSVEILWLGVTLNGIGMASIYPSFMAWVEEYFVVSNKVASLFVTAPSFGEMVLPLVIGLFINTIPMMLMYTTMLSAFFCIVVFFVVWLMTKKLNNRKLEAQNKINRLEENDLKVASPIERVNLENGNSSVSYTKGKVMVCDTESSN